MLSADNSDIIANATLFEVMTQVHTPLHKNWAAAESEAKRTRSIIVNRTPGQPRYILADYTGVTGD